MKKLHAFTSFFEFTKTQQTALWVLLTTISCLQGIYFYISSLPPAAHQPTKWVSLNLPDESAATTARKSYPIYPFNPNFISDYKAYKFGMSLVEINRLRAYRKQNLYVNSAQEFQQITGVSDSTLQLMRVYFKFPDWVTQSRQKNQYATKSMSLAPVVKKDINTASADDLKQIYGIGDGLSDRILQARQKLGAFVSMEQLNFIWGLQPEVIERLNSYFEVSELPVVQKIKINSCSLKELLQVPYVNYTVAKSILIYRSKNDQLLTIEDLLKIDQFPVDKVNIIALYLEF